MKKNVGGKKLNFIIRKMLNMVTQNVAALVFNTIIMYNHD